MNLIKVLLISTFVVHRIVFSSENLISKTPQENKLVPTMIEKTKTSNNELFFSGEARDIKTNKFAYREDHKVIIDDHGFNQKILTNYYDESGKKIAEMQSDFSLHRTLPNVKFKDLRFQITEDAKLTVDKDKNFEKYEMTILKEGKLVSKKSFDIKSNSVAGQGFDNFIKLNLSLILKEKVPLSFGVLSEGDFFSFYAYQIKPKSVNEGTRQIVALGLHPQSVFLSLFIDDLIIEYDLDQRMIKSYQGLSNLKNMKGQTQKVKIIYEF